MMGSTPKLKSLLRKTALEGFKMGIKLQTSVHVVFIIEIRSISLLTSTAFHLLKKDQKKIRLPLLKFQSEEEIANKLRKFIF